MENFTSENILKRLSAANLKSLLRLTGANFTSKMNKEELLEIALTLKEITPMIIVNHLNLDKFALEKKLNKPPPSRKKKDSDVSPLIEDYMEKITLEEETVVSPQQP
jgi:uncharacterized protein YukJ